MRRRIWNVAAMLSLAMFIAVGVVWVRSYFAADYFTRNAQRPGPVGKGSLVIDEIVISRGHVGGQHSELGNARISGFPPSAAAQYKWAVRPAAWNVGGDQGINVIGFGYGQDLSKAGYGVDGVYWAWLPCWFLAVLTATLPAVQVRRWWRQRRHHPGHCPVCGYDLRATPDRCPECGHAPMEGAR